MSQEFSLLILQPTSFCNLNCGYCYVPDRLNKSKMTPEVLEASIRCLFADKVSGDVRFLYHAGEPLTVGIDFYKLAIELVDKYKPQNVSVTHSVQTNGVLINASWAEFFVKNNFHVGVSIDGPKFLHDANRKNWAGKGSFDNTLRGFKILKNYGVETGVLSVITSKHLDYAKELIEFYVTHGMQNVGLNVEGIENDNQKSSLGNIENLAIDKYYKFIESVFDILLKDPRAVKIREISNVIDVLRRRKWDPNYSIEHLDTKDLCIITVQRDGEVSTYSPEFAGMKSEEYSNFIIGNVLEMSKMSDVKLNPNYLKIKSHYDERKRKCEDSCKYYAICGSSYLSAAYSESGSLLQTESMSCILHKQKLTDVVLDKIHDLSAKYAN